MWKPSGQMDRRTDMTKLIVAFRNFVNAPGDVHTEFWWGDLRERDQLEDLGLDGSRLLKRIFKKWNGKPWSGIFYFRGGTGGGQV